MSFRLARRAPSAWPSACAAPACWAAAAGGSAARAAPAATPAERAAAPPRPPPPARPRCIAAHVDDSSGRLTPPTRSTVATWPRGEGHDSRRRPRRRVGAAPPLTALCRLVPRRALAAAAATRQPFLLLFCLRLRDRERHDLAVGRERGVRASRVPQLLTRAEVPDDELAIEPLRGQRVGEPLAVARQRRPLNRPPGIVGVVGERLLAGDRALRDERNARPRRAQEHASSAAHSNWLSGGVGISTTCDHLVVRECRVDGIGKASLLWRKSRSVQSVVQMRVQARSANGRDSRGS